MILRIGQEASLLQNFSTTERETKQRQRKNWDLAQALVICDTGWTGVPSPKVPLESSASTRRSQNTLNPWAWVEWDIFLNRL